MNKALIYIAGALRSDIPGYINNCRKMILTAEEVRLQGYAVFIPCLDFLTGLTVGGYEFHDYFDNSFEILKRCDAIFLVPGWQTSEGTKKEIALAQELNIPVYENIMDLRANVYSPKTIGGKEND
jgi:hypothetical protein